MDETFSICIIRYEGSSCYAHFYFIYLSPEFIYSFIFLEFHSCLEFGLVWKEKLFEEDVRRTRDVFTYTTFFSVSSSCKKIDTKTAA